MFIPEFTELSNLPVSSKRNKLKPYISVVLITNGKNDPTETINSIYFLIKKIEELSEFIIINNSFGNYHYEKLLDLLPLVRILTPRERLCLNDAISLSIQESSSNIIFFINENYIIKSFNLDTINNYIKDEYTGIAVPIILNENEEQLPNLVYAKNHNGFLNIFSVDYIMQDKSILYPKYFSFLLKKNIFKNKDIELTYYNNENYVLLELGYKTLKEGFLINQIRNLKIIYNSDVIQDINMKFEEEDYILFHLNNINEDKIIKRIKGYLFKKFIIALITFNIKVIKSIMNSLKKIKKKKNKKIYEKKIEDSLIFSIINNEKK